ncbi:MAG: hypothetical protein E7478_02035 [Ruminococcaceae bacterium]|nr:hypothetical protein [Oscillospiraceae bacterium]
MNKLNTTIILSLILMLSGCAANTDEAPSATTAATTTTVATTTTAAATTQATTTSAQTTAVMEQSEPAETTAVTTTNIVTDQQDLVAADALVDSDTVPKYVNVGETVESDPEADQLASEREDNIPVATTEEAEQHAQDRQDRQDMAENTDAYTTDGIPLTTDGHLTAPAKPTANYKLPDDAQLEFTGNASTALLTELPDGCYWTPRHKYENAFTDPAGNVWLNTESDFLSGNRGEGYYSPDGTYHFSQAETDAAIAFNEEIQSHHDNGPSNDGTSGMSEEHANDLLNLRGF